MMLRPESRSPARPRLLSAPPPAPRLPAQRAVSRRPADPHAVLLVPFDDGALKYTRQRRRLGSRRFRHVRGGRRIRLGGLDALMRREHEYHGWPQIISGGMGSASASATASSTRRSWGACIRIRRLRDYIPSRLHRALVDNTLLLRHRVEPILPVQLRRPLGRLQSNVVYGAVVYSLARWVLGSSSTLGAEVCEGRTVDRWQYGLHV
ncbi:hypothetical protein B0H16DRAFT_239997 [Mycena metata]|uniref:Uncharacterized protein n=1 Tax=Mycena metata TaxID=1033252 RepID=A0AAD7HWA5_9AGAR|nr:hypothetical protein B0H16DRAFT_239997 [Mycena metata]